VRKSTTFNSGIDPQTILPSPILLISAEFNIFGQNNHNMSGIKSFISCICILIYLSIFMVCNSCDDTVCSDLGTAQVIIIFNDEISRSVKSIIIDSITSPGTDSILARMDTIASCSLPVNTSVDSTIFYFFRPGTIDTMVVRYTRVYSLLSEECGFKTVYGNVNAGYHTFPEVISKNNELNDANKSNIEVYF
jgi:hypothetical protein